MRIPLFLCIKKGQEVFPVLASVSKLLELACSRLQQS